jgi:hypothetical protein
MYLTSPRLASALIVAGGFALLLALLPAWILAQVRSDAAAFDSLGGFRLEDPLPDVQRFAEERGMTARCEVHFGEEFCEVSRDDPGLLILYVESGTIVGITHERTAGEASADLRSSSRLGLPIHERRDSIRFDVWTNNRRSVVRTLLCPDTIGVAGCVERVERVTPEDLEILLRGWRNAARPWL